MNQNNLEKAKKYFNNGLQYFNAKDYIKAETEFLESLKFYPNRISVIINILQIYLLTENLIKIEIFLNRFQDNNIISIIKSYQYYLLKKYDKSIAECEDLLKSELENIKTQIYDLLAKNFFKKENFLKTIFYYKKIKSINKNDYLNYYNIGCLFLLLGRKKQAYYYFKKSNRINPVDNLVTWNLAWCSLALGHLDMGFKLFEKRWDIVEGHKKRFVNIHEINNLEHIINKKVLVWDEFGLGDVIQFSRFVIDLLKYTKKITLVVNKSLVQLLNFLDKDIKVTTYEDLNVEDIDYQISICSLPRILRLKNFQDITFKKIILPNTYPQEFRKYNIKDDTFNVGVAWSGNPKNSNDIYRSIPFKNFDSIFRIPKTKFFRLHQNLEENAFNNNNITDLGDKNFFELSYFLKKLDLIISVDTSIIHLCGILGIKSILLLNLNSDWRWFLDDEKTIWYPSIQIFKQRCYDNWNNVFEKLNSEILLLSKKKFNKL